MINFVRPLATSIHLFVLVACVACYSQALAGQCCPQCKTNCSLSVEKVDRSKHCWKVETEQVCVPRVVFPWQRPRLDRQSHGCSDPGCTGDNTLKSNGAFVLTVRKLKKHKYKCPECEYTWTVDHSTSCTEATISKEPQEETTAVDIDSPHSTEFSIEDRGNEISLDPANESNSN